MTTFSYTGEFASYTVKSTGVHDIFAYGPQGGGNAYAGNGAEIGGDVTLTAGETLTIAVGGAGKGASGSEYAGDGGGSFVVVPGSTPTPLVIAGGGGVSRQSAVAWSPNGQTGPWGSGSNNPGYGSNGKTGGVLVAQLTNTPKLGFADLVSHHSIST